MSDTPLASGPAGRFYARYFHDASVTLSVTSLPAAVIEGHERSRNGCLVWLKGLFGRSQCRCSSDFGFGDRTSARIATFGIGFPRHHHLEGDRHGQGSAKK